MFNGAPRPINFNFLKLNKYDFIVEKTELLRECPSVCWSVHRSIHEHKLKSGKTSGLGAFWVVVPKGADDMCFHSEEISPSLPSSSYPPPPRGPCTSLKALTLALRPISQPQGPNPSLKPLFQP